MTDLAEDAVEEFLAHHGIKGMKWGVHRSSRTAGSSGGHKPAWHSPPPKKAPIAANHKTSGRVGKSKKQISEEAQQLHEIRMKVKKHGIHSLTNKELELVNRRLELQQKYMKANPKKKNPIVDLLLDAVLSDHGSASIKKILSDRGASDTMSKAVEAALLLNKVARKK